MKKTFLSKTMVTILTVALVAMTGCGKQDTGKKVVEEEAKELCYASVDVNPSIELMIQEGNTVVQVNAANEDAEKILEGLTIVGEDVEDAAEEIAESLAKNGYLNKECVNEVLISVEDNSISEEVLQGINAGIERYIQAEELKVNLLQKKITITDEERITAEESEVSVGKYKLIQELMEKGEGRSLEELANVSIKELTEYAVQNNLELEELLETYQESLEDAIEDALETDNHVTGVFEENKVASEELYDGDEDEEDEEDWCNVNKYTAPVPPDRRVPGRCIIYDSSQLNQNSKILEIAKCINAGMVSVDI